MTFKVLEIENNRIHYFCLSKILNIINRDRSTDWINYNETDYAEGWLTFCEGDIYSCKEIS